jgi:hypothetical protein
VSVINPDPGERRRMVGELKAVRRRAIWRVEDPKLAKLDIATLANLAVQYAGGGSSLTSALEQLLRGAIARLPEGLKRYAALGIYGLDRDPGDGKPTDWRKRVFREFYSHLALNTYEDEIEPGIIEAIAAEVQALMRPVASDGFQGVISRTSATAASVTPEPASRPYIRRPSLDSTVSSAVEEANEGGGHVFIAGDAGVGKTTYVRDALTQSDMQKVIWLDASTEDRLYASITSFLTERGLHTARSSKAVLRANFAQQLREQRGERTTVVVDDFDDPDFIYDLLPGDIPCGIIVTSRLRPSDPSWPCIVVSDMSEDEAVELVRTVLPDVDEPQARALALTFGCRPSLIEDACSYVAKEPSINAVDLTQLFATNATEAIEAISRRSVDHLADVYREIIRNLARKHPASLRLLELIAFCSAHFAPKEYLGSFLLGKPYLTAADAPLAHMRLQAALRPLTENCLVRDAPGVIVMPFLVQAVFQDLMRDRLESVGEEASRLQASRSQLYGAGWTLGSIATRFTCQSILRARVSNRRTNRIDSFLSDPSGAARWMILVGEACGRHLQLEAMLLAIMAAADSKRSADVNLSLKAFSPRSYEDARVAVRHAPQLLREDVELSINLSRAIVEANWGVDAYIDETMQAKIEELKISLRLGDFRKFFDPYIRTPDGDVDLSILIDFTS